MTTTLGQLQLVGFEFLTGVEVGTGRVIEQLARSRPAGRETTIFLVIFRPPIRSFLILTGSELWV